MPPASAGHGPIGTTQCLNAAASKREISFASPISMTNSKNTLLLILNERKTLAEQIQREILENYYFVPVFRHAFVNAIGPRVAAKKWQDVFPTYETSGYPYPWEDIKLTETAAAEK